MSLKYLDELVQKGVKLTPMMQQYHEIKKKYPECFLLFRMGDFYELFFDDAVQAAPLLNITLTHRGKLGDDKVPMAGIPHHAASTYIDRLTSAGHRAAICEQIEDPKSAVGIVKRAVTQIVSPGHPYDLDKLEQKESYYSFAYKKINQQFFVTVIDFTTGDFWGQVHQDKSSFYHFIRSLNPKEWVTYFDQIEKEGSPELELIIQQCETLKNHLSEEFFDSSVTGEYIQKIVPKYQSDKVLQKKKDILCPLGALSYFLVKTQELNKFVHIKGFRLEAPEEHMQVTYSTLMGIEILPSQRERYKESLLGFMDHTQSSMGARKLKKFFEKPLRNKQHIQARQQSLSYFMAQPEIHLEMREFLKEVRDLERILAKYATAKIRPQDLLAIADSIQVFQDLDALLDYKKLPALKALTKEEKAALQELQRLIESAIEREIGTSFEKGNVIKTGYHKKRDRLKKLSRGAHEQLDELEEQYRQQTGLNKLKIKSNNVFGHFIEVSKAASSSLPKKFVVKQTLVNCQRFITPELEEIEKEVVNAKDKLQKMERQIFLEIVEQGESKSQHILKLADFLSTLDTLQSLAWVSCQEEFTRPELMDAPQIELKGAWHPLVKKSVPSFVHHNLSLDHDVHLGVITGPNMAGKTTVMREAAIIQFLTQIGSFVPASQAQVSLCDQIFSRLGASDNILKGQSTFMVEMVETAEILRHATHQSLIILDEVGRGTSTYDGLSIAWALCEHLMTHTKALTLFATHYHELIELAEKNDCAKNLTVATIVNGKDIQFCYELIEQGAPQSFGLYVAKMAGLPNNLLKRAEDLLDELESEQKNGATPMTRTELDSSQLSLFDSKPSELSEIEDSLRQIDLMNMTPLQAMNELSKLKDFLRLH